LKKLERKLPASRAVAQLDVRLGAVAANYRLCRTLSGTAVAGVVKADAYGMGMAPVARKLAAAGCDTFFVARIEEGVALRPLVPDARIFVLDGPRPQAVPLLLAHKLTPVLNSLADIAHWRARTRRQAALHIDTGMNRLGLGADEFARLAAAPRKLLAGIDIVLIMSHLACADDPQAAMNGEQLARFRSALAMLPPAKASLASSGGVLLGRDYAFDLVRPGLGLYGGNPQPARPNPFRRVARLTGKILQIRRVDRGEPVGYGAAHKVARPSVLATVALGYADGLMRAMGNHGKGAIAGRIVPVAGRVSMDLAIMDVTGVPPSQCRTGSDVEFFGDTIPVEAAAAAAGTVSYELLTSLGPRIPRRYSGAVA
jgi:alanine racemase